MTLAKAWASLSYLQGSEHLRLWEILAGETRLEAKPVSLLQTFLLIPLCLPQCPRAVQTMHAGPWAPPGLSSKRPQQEEKGDCDMFKLSKVIDGDHIHCIIHMILM